MHSSILPAAWRRALFGIILGCLFAASSVVPTRAQDPARNFESEFYRAVELLKAGKHADAAVILEPLSKRKEADGQTFYALGVALLVSEENAPTPNRDRLLRARAAFLRAKELGVKAPELDNLLRSIRADGTLAGRSANAEANAAMNEATRYFSGGDYEQAAANYERAAKLDPQLYEAALYTGNSYYALKQWDKAGAWFAKAIALDPARETAHRYWGDAIMLSGDNAAAREKFLDAVIAEPYNQLAWRGLIQWAQRNNVKLAHANVQIPTSVSTGENGNVNITLGMNDKAEDGSFAWTMYGIARALWLPSNGKLGEKFVKQFPQEKVYRHSLAEEMDGLGLVVTTVRARANDKKSPIKQLNPSLATLLKLQEQGLLEAYVLLARSDAGIAQDYPAYRQANRDKIRRYLTEYVLQGGGS